MSKYKVIVYIKERENLTAFLFEEIESVQEDRGILHLYKNPVRSPANYVFKEWVYYKLEGETP